MHCTDLHIYNLIHISTALDCLVVCADGYNLARIPYKQSIGRGRRHERERRERERERERKREKKREREREKR